MKKKNRKLRSMSVSDLEKLPTKGLLARFKRLHICEESLGLSDRNGIYENPDNLIEFKNTSEWKTESEKMKEILAKHEHIERKTA
jgi:hypothetical protein